MCILAHCTMKRTILYLILLFSALAVSGQPLYFERIDTRYGLSQNTVNEIIQDSRTVRISKYSNPYLTGLALWATIRYVQLSKGRTVVSTSEPMPVFLSMTLKRTGSVK